MKNIYVHLVDGEARWTIGLLRFRDRAVREETLCCVLGHDLHLTLTVPLSTQMYQWVPVNLMLG